MSGAATGAAADAAVAAATASATERPVTIAAAAATASAVGAALGSAVESGGPTGPVVGCVMVEIPVVELSRPQKHVTEKAARTVGCGRLCIASGCHRHRPCPKPPIDRTERRASAVEWRVVR
jgi:hypothetical protein